MSRMILRLHGSLRPKPIHASPAPRLLRVAARNFPTSLNYGQIFGVFAMRSLATTSNPSKPPPAEPEDAAPTISVVLSEIRAQQKAFQSKVTRTNADVNASHLEDNARLEILRGGAPSLQLEPEAGRLLLDPARVPPLFAPFVPPTSEENAAVGAATSPGRELRRPTGKLQLHATVNVPRAPPPPRGIIYPKSAERLQVSFKPPPPAENIVPAPPPPTGPRFLESTTHKLKVLLETTDVDKEKIEVRSRMLNIGKPDKEGEKERSAATSATAAPPVEHALSSDVAPVRTDILGNAVSTPPAPEQRLLTSVVMKQKFKVVPLDPSGRFAKSTAPPTAGEGLQTEQEDSDGSDKNANSRRWKRLKYTMAAFGVVATIVGGYLMIVVGSPKYDERGRLIRDKYSHLPLRLQYYNRIRDELENCNRMIKEPSRDKLLPDALEPPYYQPPYTLVLEFTDLLVHPEWTYQNGWRFKKRPGVDQFLEALYTRFEVVVYTAQMGMTVFPIMDALDGKNLISYKLVRDATNFVDGDHVKDLDKINRDLSKVVVVDWNESSVKLHKDNLFKIPRWEGNDDDSTLFDLAAFLIAISEWEVQDVRAVLQYYAQFENPLAKFKENQMQALQATQS